VDLRSLSSRQVKDKEDNPTLWWATGDTSSERKEREGKQKEVRELLWSRTMMRREEMSRGEEGGVSRHG
jgi:hypothetical protein